MAIDFFKTELLNAQHRFNETFGRQSVCNIRERYITIMSVITLGLLEKRIRQTGNRADARDEAREFIRRRDLLKAYFDKAEEEFNDFNERRLKADERTGYRNKNVN